MWPNAQETADLVTFTEEILNGKLHFSCSVRVNNQDARLMSVLVAVINLSYHEQFTQ